jgi:hypothetical protein
VTQGRVNGVFYKRDEERIAQVKEALAGDW